MIRIRSYIRISNRNRIRGILFFLMPVAVQAQNFVSEKAKDSLLAQLKIQSGPDTNRARTLIYLSQYYIQQSADSPEGIAIVNEAFEISVKNKHRQFQVWALLNRARLEAHPGSHREAIPLADSAARLAKQYEEKLFQGRAYWVMSNCYLELQVYSSALDYAFQALRIAEEINDKWSMPGLYGNITGCFLSQKKFDDALLYQRKELELNRALKRESYVATNTNSLAETYLEMGYPDSAYPYNAEAEKMVRALGKKAPNWQLGYIYGVRAAIYEKQGDILSGDDKKILADSNYRLSLGHYLFHLSEIKRLDKEGSFYLSGVMIGEISTSIARIFFKLRDYRSMEPYLQVGIRVGIEQGSGQDLEKAYRLQASLDSVNGNFAAAFHHYKLADHFYDSIHSAENIRLLERYQNQHYFEKREREIQILSSEEKLKATRQKQKRDFAYLLSGFIVLGSGYGLYRFRRLSKQKAEQKRLKERLAISQDLHDQVGSTLSSIAVYSKVAQVESGKGNPAKMNELLETIRATSGKIVNEMNDIVWAINPRNDSLEKVIQRMESFARPLLLSRNIQFRFTSDPTIAQLHLEMEQRKNLYLIYKEAITNALKYSGASLVEASVSRQAGLLELKVRDNGVGFNMAQVSQNAESLSGNGLRNMFSRAREMNANLQIDTGKGDGTEIKLLLPVA